MILYTELRGQEALEYLEPLARLRISVFREWPYLYDGDMAYETKYLKTYFSSPNSFIVLARNDKDQIVGASTAIWLNDADPQFQKPFQEKNYDLEKICYYGESVLEKEYRGQGIGKEFMKRRENFARSFPQVRHAAFCAVLRPEHHPLKNRDYRPLDGFWESQGFQMIPDLQAEYVWKDLGDEKETPKLLQFWLKDLK